MRTRLGTARRKSVGKEQATPIWESHFDFPFLKLRETKKKKKFRASIVDQLWPWRWGCDHEHLLFFMGVYSLISKNNKWHEQQCCLSQKILPLTLSSHFTHPLIWEDVDILLASQTIHVCEEEKIENRWETTYVPSEYFQTALKSSETHEGKNIPVPSLASVFWDTSKENQEQREVTLWKASWPWQRKSMGNPNTVNNCFCLF